MLVMTMASPATVIRVSSSALLRAGTAGWALPLSSRRCAGRPGPGRRAGPGWGSSSAPTATHPAGWTGSSISGPRLVWVMLHMLPLIQVLVIPASLRASMMACRPIRSGLALSRWRWVISILWVVTSSSLLGVPVGRSFQAASSRTVSSVGASPVRGRVPPVQGISGGQGPVTPAVPGWPWVEHRSVAPVQQAFPGWFTAKCWMRGLLGFRLRRLSACCPCRSPAPPGGIARPPGPSPPD